MQDWNQQMIEEFHAKGGRGITRFGDSLLLLTSTGARSGERRTTPLMFHRDKDNLVIVASKAGAPEHPAWYLNLEADPEVEIQVLDAVVPATASTAHRPERERLWALMREIWPAYDEYRTRTDREIPVVVLTPRP